jgi:TPR repeat protein
MLISGDPVPQDTERGLAMLRLSAGQDNPQAIALLINLLRNSEDAEAHEEEAAAWSKRLESLRRK